MLGVQVSSQLRLHCALRHLNSVKKLTHIL